MHLRTTARLPLKLEAVFEFFARAENLQRLTPDWLHFRIESPPPITIREGTIIDYRIRLHGIPLTWRSEITTWNPPHVFVDTQIRGPYRRWIHTHRFSSSGTDTVVDDHVDFDVPGGALAGWFVARNLRAIFAYRHDALRRELGLPEAPAPPIVVS